MGVVFDSQDTRPLTEQIETADGGPCAWADAYAAWVYKEATQAIDAYMASAPWRRRVTLHALPDYEPHIISTDNGDVPLSLTRGGRYLTLHPAIFRNDDQMFLHAIPDKIAQACIRTIDDRITRATDAARLGDLVLVGVRHDVGKLRLLLWRNDGPGGKPWTLDDPLDLGWSFDLGVTVAVREMEEAAVP